VCRFQEDKGAHSFIQLVLTLFFSKAFSDVFTFLLALLKDVKI